MTNQRLGAGSAALVLALAGTLTGLVAGAVPTSTHAAAYAADGRTAASTASTASAPAVSGRAVVDRRVIGESVRGRPIRAYRLGESGPGIPTAVLISTMHGNEGRTRLILESLRDGRRISGIDLWVVPVYNPDGLARGTRHNARGIDLNRNYPHDWAPLDGNYESGPRPESEPETRAMMRFLAEVRPRWVVSFHQPLHGVDTDTKDPRFAQRLARALRLPRKEFRCGGVCHGTMTSWYNAHFDGTAITVEYGPNPSTRLMRRTAPRQLLRLFGARRGTAHTDRG